MNRVSFQRIDFFLLLPAIFLVLISLATFYSIDIALFKQQSLFFLISILFYFFFINVDYRIFGVYSKAIYAIALLLLIILFFIGVEAKGAIRWIDFFGVRLQFSELIKPFFIIFLSHFLGSNSSRSFLKYLGSLLVIVPIFALTLRQPDLGNASIYLITSSLMIVMYGFPFIYYVVSVILSLIPLPLFYSFLYDYQKQRITSFLNFSFDPFGSSYNKIQSLISIGSGEFTGKGFGQATQSILKFLPERHTDFIFATISESLGFVGGGLVLMLFIFLLYRIIKIIINVDDKFSYYISLGFFFLLLTHVFLNIGMNLGILPVVGITLPFVSYGGSSLVTSFMMLGIISSISFETMDRKKHLMEIS